MTSVEDSFGRFLTLGYTADTLTSVADSSGRSVAYGYDGDFNLTSFTDPAGKVWQYGYDNDHRITSLINPLAITTAINTYDSLDRVKTQTVVRQTGSATYNYYFSGYRNIEEDPEGHRIIYSFDGKGRSVGIENALGYKIVKEFDGQDHLVKITDPRMNSSEFFYDGDHNLTRIIDADLHETVNEYDAQNRLTQVTDALLHASTFTYNARHQPTSTTLYPGAGVALTTRADYDAAGRLISLENFNGTFTTYDYDNANRLTGLSVSRPDASIVAAYSFTLDENGNRTGVSEQVPLTASPLTQETNYTYNPQKTACSMPGRYRFPMILKGNLTPRTPTLSLLTRSTGYRASAESLMQISAMMGPAEELLSPVTG